jgi:hypothetical protein
MSDLKTDLNVKALPKPVSLTPEEVQQVAAGTAAALPPGSKPPTLIGIRKADQ